MARQIIIDTDAGWDDWLALLFLMKCDDLQILGVTVTGVGEAHLGPGMSNVNKLLIYGGQSANVYPGATSSLSASYGVFPEVFRTTIDNFCGNTVPKGSGSSVISKTSSTEYLRQAFDTAAGAGTTVDVLAIGGFTNLAALFDAYPLAGANGPASYKAGIGTIYSMAGAIPPVPGDVWAPGDQPPWDDYPGNTAAEWNVFVDPLAAQIVLNSQGLNTVLVPLNATNSAPITPTFIQQYIARSRDAYSAFVGQVLSSSPTPITEKEPNFFYDPLAAAVLATQAQSDPRSTLVVTQQLQLQVSTEPGDTLGALTPTNRGPLPQITVCTGTAQTLETFVALFDNATSPLRP